MCLHIFIYAMSNHMLINRMRSKHKFPIVSQFSMYRTSDYICLCAVVIRLKAIKELSNSLSTHIGLIYIYSKPDRWVCSLSTWLCVKFTAQACDRARERKEKKAAAASKCNWSIFKSYHHVCVDKTPLLLLLLISFHPMLWTLHLCARTIEML